MKANNAWSLAVARVAGVQVEVHVTFVLLLAWLSISLVRRGFSTSVLLHVLTFALGIAVCLVLHELGHALTARRLGLQTSEISLTPMGGSSNVLDMPEAPRVELPVVLAGPLVSLLLAGGFALLAWLGPGLEAPQSYLDESASLSSQLMWFNLVLAGYNLLPIFPMDGGRALRAGLAFFMPFVKATRIASRMAQVLSVVMAVAGLLEQPVLLLTAVWIWMSARREVKAVRTRHALKSFAVRDVMVIGPTLDVDASLGEASRVFGTTFQTEFPVMRGSDVVGVLGFKELLDGLERHGETAAVSFAMRAEFNGVDAQMPLEEVLTQMKESSDPLVLVTEGDRYVGVLPRSNLNELVRIARALEKHAN